MDFVERNLKLIIQILLLATIAIVPFVRVDDLYFPFISGKAYAFRALVAVAFFFWIWLLLKEKTYRPNWKNPFVAALGLFFVAQLVASFFGVDPIYSLFSSIERHDGVLQYGFWLVYFFMLLSVFKTRQDWKILFSTFVLVAVALSAYSWLNYESQVQLSGIFGNPAYFAAFLLFAIGFSAVAFQQKFFHPHPARYLFLAAAVLFTVTLVFTQIRGAYVGLAGGVFLFCLLAAMFLRKENKKLAYAALGVLLLGVLSAGVLFAAKDTSFVQNAPILSRVAEATRIWESGSVRERILNWSIALKAFQEKPVFGYGPENFGSAANKYYDYRIGAGEPWFDRAHNQPLDTLATGGIVVFAGYLFWLGAASFFIFKIARRKKILGLLLASTFLAYFLQGLFLFDLLAVYLGLFPFLAFLIYQLRTPEAQKSKEEREKRLSITTPKYLPIIGLVGLTSLFVIYTTVFIPYKANAAAIQFFAYSESGFFKEAKPFAEEAFSIKSPYTSWEVRKRMGWQFAGVLEYEVIEEMSPEQVQAVKEMYERITPELERFLEARPSDPQMYYVLGRIYRFGYEKLGYNDLSKAEAVFQKAFEHSDLRVEYYNELAKILLLDNKYEDAERVLKDYTARVPREWSESFPFVTLGHFYFIAGKHEQAFEQYEKAREQGHRFYEIGPEYSRYLFVAQEVGEYQRIVDMAKAYLDRWGPDADTYFNIAVAYLNTGDSESARRFFLNAIALNAKYEEYRAFFTQ